MKELQQRDLIQKLFQAGITKAPAISTRTDIPISTVYRIISKLRKNDGIERKKGSGKSRKLMSNDGRALVQLAIQNRKMSVRNLTSKFNLTRRKNLSHETVRKELLRRGYNRKLARRIPLLTEKHRQQRVSWAKDNKRTDWEKVVFSDEMSIWLSGNRVYLWCKGDEKAVKPTCKHTPKLHVWGAFSARGTFPLKVFRENLTGYVYTNILNECLPTQAAVLYPDGWVLQEDNDPKHTSKIARKFREDSDIGRMDWPSCSPDLNPIENLWAWMKHQIDLTSPSSLKELETTLYQVWNSIEPEFLLSYWQSMPKRIKLVTSTKGFKIKY